MAGVVTGTQRWRTKIWGETAAPLHPGVAKILFPCALAEENSGGGFWDVPVPNPRTPSVPLGSSACLASLRRAAAKLEEGAAWTDKVLLAAGLPLGTREPLRGEGVRGLTVAVVRVAVDSIPREGDFDSWLMPAKERRAGSAPPRAAGTTGTAPGPPRTPSPQHQSPPKPTPKRDPHQIPAHPIHHPPQKAPPGLTQ